MRTLLRNVYKDRTTLLCIAMHISGQETKSRLNPTSLFFLKPVQVDCGLNFGHERKLVQLSAGVRETRASLAQTEETVNRKRGKIRLHEGALFVRA